MEDRLQSDRLNCPERSLTFPDSLPTRFYCDMASRLKDVPVKAAGFIGPLGQ